VLLLDRLLHQLPQQTSEQILSSLEQRCILSPRGRLSTFAVEGHRFSPDLGGRQPAVNRVNPEETRWPSLSRNLSGERSPRGFAASAPRGRKRRKISRSQNYRTLGTLPLRAALLLTPDLGACRLRLCRLFPVPCSLSPSSR